MARGLAHAHRHGVVHRDIKPANVMFADDGLVKIVDFGVARSASRGSITETGITVGTLAYMAPEQLLKERDVTAASDVWSLGIVLYEMTTGQRPFAGKDIGPLLRSILHDPVPPLRIPGAAGDAPRPHPQAGPRQGSAGAADRGWSWPSSCHVCAARSRARESAVPERRLRPERWLLPVWAWLPS